jgi:hypothetical protein
MYFFRRNDEVAINDDDPDARVVDITDKLGIEKANAGDDVNLDFYGKGKRNDLHPGSNVQLTKS